MDPVRPLFAMSDRSHERLQAMQERREDVWMSETYCWN